jgi:hypothetical protein
MEQITISGEVFNAPLRYEEGHELSAGEAAALNQAYHDRLRNSFAPRVKAAKAAGSFDLATSQAEFDTYATDYAFGAGKGRGGAVKDPVQAEALAVAKSQIRVALKKQGKKAEANAITDAANKLLVHPVHGPLVMALAKQRVEEAQAAAAVDISDLVSDLPAKSAAA